MKRLSIAVATLIFGIAALASTAQAGPGGSAGYPYYSPSAYVGAPVKISHAPGTQSASGHMVLTGWYGNDGTVCRNLDLACTGGHGPIGWFCQCPTFTGTWSAD